MRTLAERIRATTEIGIKEKTIIENEKSFLESVFKQCTEERKIGEIKIKRSGDELSEYKLENGSYVYIKSDGNNGFETMIISPTQRKENDFSGKGSAYIYAHNSYRAINPDKRVLKVLYKTEDDRGETMLSIGLDEGSSYYNDMQSILTRGTSETIIDYIREMPEGDITFELLRNDFNKIFEGTDREVKVYTDEQIAIMNLEKENKQIKDSQELSAAKVREKVTNLEKENANLKEENEVLEKVNNGFKRENKEIEQENRDLKAENDSLKTVIKEKTHKIKRIRDFIIKRCGKIPFLGKKILKEMQSELGVNELGSGENNQKSGEER